MVTEPEEYSTVPEKSEAEKMKEYEALIANGGQARISDQTSEKELEQMAKQETLMTWSFPNLKRELVMNQNR